MKAHIGPLSRRRVLALLGIFTATGTTGDGAGLDRFLPPGRTTLCGYGRQALAIGLHRVGTGAGDVVLLPGFICRDLIGAVRTVGAEVVFYDIDEQFHIVADSLDRAGASRVRAVVAVNYFGFPQPLDDLFPWCRAHGAVLIEDNAHGFLSADGDIPLGHRGDLGIFSLRKTLALPNGGALVDNRPEEADSLGGAPRFEDSSLRIEVAWAAKRGVKRVMAFGGPSTVGPVLGAIRGLRRFAPGSDVEIMSPDAEIAIPQEKLAPVTRRLLQRTAVDEEITRRRKLYRECDALLKDASEVRPLFSELPAEVVPQGFPFVYVGNEPRQFADRWWRLGVPIVSWPDLPHAFASNAPPHCHRVMLVPFLW
jgi:hypothetical protein